MKREKSLYIGISGVFLGILLAMAVCSGETLALFSDKKDVINSGIAGSVEVEIEEEISGLTKSNIAVKNTGETSAYLRIKVTLPEIPGVTITAVRDSEKWKEGADGYFYYDEIVAPGSDTEILYRSITYDRIPERVSPDQLQIIIYSEAVQSTYVEIECDDGCVNAAEHVFRHFKDSN